MSDYIMTIDSDADDAGQPSTLEKTKRDPSDDAKLDPDFSFDAAGDLYVDFLTKSIGVEDLVKTGSKPVC
jgi:ATP-dependent RNA helicase DDX27